MFDSEYASAMNHEVFKSLVENCIIRATKFHYDPMYKLSKD